MRDAGRCWTRMNAEQNRKIEELYLEMFEKLNIAIRQFAKRQMTWYRRMERNGVDIHWVDGTLSDKEKLDEVCRLYEGFAASNKDK